MGRDPKSATLFALRSCFNSRARVGRDASCISTATTSSEFQLTRPRGARLEQLANQVPASWFQLTRPRGARQEIETLDKMLNPFQLTRPRGARQVAFHKYVRRVMVSTHAPAWGATRVRRPRKSLPSCFNSRARVGRDIFSSIHSDGLKFVSTHAPAWGATSQGWRVCDTVRVSTHAPAWGATVLSKP